VIYYFYYSSDSCNSNDKLSKENSTNTNLTENSFIKDVYQTSCSNSILSSPCDVSLISKKESSNDNLSDLKTADNTPLDNKIIYQDSLNFVSDFNKISNNANQVNKKNCAFFYIEEKKFLNFYKENNQGFDFIDLPIKKNSETTIFKNCFFRKNVPSAAPILKSLNFENNNFNDIFNVNDEKGYLKSFYEKNPPILDNISQVESINNSFCSNGHPNYKKSLNENNKDIFQTKTNYSPKLNNSNFGLFKNSMNNQLLNENEDINIKDSSELFNNLIYSLSENNHLGNYFNSSAIENYENNENQSSFFLNSNKENCYGINRLEDIYHNDFNTSSHFYPMDAEYMSENNNIFS